MGAREYIEDASDRVATWCAVLLVAYLLDELGCLPPEPHGFAYRELPLKSAAPIDARDQTPFPMPLRLVQAAMPRPGRDGRALPDEAPSGH